MLDEPANGLDPQSIHWLRDFLKDYAAQGNSVFVSSHLLSEMELMADHVVVIAKGRLVADASMADIVAKSRRNDVLVRTEVADRDRLSGELSGMGFTVQPEGADGIAVTGATTEGVGRAAHALGVALLELTARVASLEDAFLELTDSDQQYKVGGDR